MTRCSARFAGVLLLWLASSGFTDVPALQRLGPEPAGIAPAALGKAEAQQSCSPSRGGRLRLSGDVRSTLPRCKQLQLNAKIADGCTLHAAMANLGTDPLSFRIATDRGDRGYVDESVRELAAASGWQDLTFAIRTDVPLSRIRFSVEGKQPARGVFSRPLLSCPSAAAKKPPHNVLLISLDTLRADRVGVWGHKGGLTPNLDRIAGQGTSFLQTYAQYPNTHGSHAALFTGQYPSQIGMTGGLHAALGPRQATLASELAARGYVTLAFTEDAYVGSAYGFDRGFDRYHDGDASDTKFLGEARVTFGRALDWIRTRPAQPFFMFLHTYEVHTPYAPDDAARAKLAPVRPDYQGSLPHVFEGLETTMFNFKQLALDANDLRHIGWLYDAEVWSLDQRVGELFASLQQLGVLDSTLIVLFSDHGEEFGEHGALAHGENLHQETMHVPLIYRAPGLVPVGLRVETLTGLLDVPSTIADLLRIGPILRNTAGRSHAAWMRLEPTPEPRPTFSELVKSATACGTPREGGFGTCHFDGVALRDENYVYVHSQAKRQEWLYDRRVDPGETNNLAATKRDVAIQYRRQVDAFRRSATKRGLPAADAQVDLATQSKLRALGYAQ